MIARLDDNRPFFFMEASECAAKLNSWKAAHPESANSGGYGAIMMHVTGLGSAVGAVHQLVESAFFGGATAHYPSLLGLTLQAREADTPGSWLRYALGMAAEPLRGPVRGHEAAWPR